MHKILNIIITIISLFIPLHHANASPNAVINISTSSGITDSDIQNTLKTINLTNSYMKTNFNRVLLNNVSLKLIKDNSLGNSRTSQSFSKHGYVVVTLKDTYTDYYSMFLVAHELIHQYQLDAVPYTILNKNLWFTEGMADYLAMKISNINGKNMEYAFRNYAQSSLNFNYSLHDITSRDGWEYHSKNSNPYAMADRAVLSLVNQYSKDLLFTYLNTLTTHDAEAALRLVYGLEINDIIFQMIKIQLNFKNMLGGYILG